MLRWTGAAAVLVAGLIAAGTAHAAPGANGPIVFNSDRSIYELDPATGHETKLPEVVPGFGGLDVSFDARRIAYSASHVIYAMNFDGSGLRQLTDADHFADDPAFSSEGLELVFERDYGLWVMDADGSHAHSITPSASISNAYYDPAWSVDGNHIAATHDQQVVVMNKDGSGQVSLTPPDLMCPSSFRTFDGTQPAWSPDGKRIAFTGPVTCRNSLGTDIWVMNADGSGKVDLIGDDGTQDSSPAFSDDGTQIVFTREVDGAPQLFTVPATGGAVSPVSTGLPAENGPVWSRAPEAPRINAKVLDHTLKLGHRVRIAGEVQPPQAGKVHVTITRHGHRVARRTVRLRQSKAAFPSSTYKLRYKPRKAGRYRVVATLGKGAAKSHVARFHVKR